MAIDHGDVTVWYVWEDDRMRAVMVAGERTEDSKKLSEMWQSMKGH